jgi:hypothetical protein
VSKSGYRGKIHDDFFSSRYCRLFRIQASTVRMSIEEYRNTIGRRAEVKERGIELLLRNGKERQMQ